MSERCVERWRQLVSNLTDSEPALVAIDGLAGSGKTVLADHLVSIDVGRPVIVVHADEFAGPETRDWRSWNAKEGYENHLDHRALEHDLLLPLALGRSATFYPFDWTRRETAAPLTVEPRGIVIIEGVFLLRPRLRAYWNLTVWVDTPRAVREARLRQRGEQDEGWITQWMRAEDVYERRDRPASIADLNTSNI